MAQKFDVIVIGSGPGGYVAAIRAGQLGLRTAIVERAELGGICLNWGCVPTKALLRSAEVLRNMHHAKDYGLSVDHVSYDLEAIVKRSRNVAKQLSSGVAHLLKKNKVTLITGTATLGSASTVKVKTDKGEESLEAQNIIIATGARARDLPGLEADGVRVWSYRHALVPAYQPKKLLVIGSGAIGIEFASFYHALGIDTTVVEVMDRVLPVEDAEISAFAKKAFIKQGLKIHEKTTVTALDRQKDAVIATIKTPEGEKKESFDTVISAVGIVGNTENLGLEALGVKIDRTHIVTDPYCHTGVDGLWAIGDVAGAPWLAHKASHEGVMVVEKIAGLNVHPIKPGAVPGCTYCHPQIASVGLTEALAKEKGYDVKIGRFPFIGNGKAIAMGEPEGMVKTVFDAKTGALLGAHMVGAEVTEMIQGYTIARTLETTEAELMETIFPHPTISEAMHEAVLDAFGRVIHM